MPENSENRLWPAILRARQNIAPIMKTARNPHFGNAYAPLDEVQSKVNAALWAEGLLLTSNFESGGLNVRVIHVESGEATRDNIVPLVGCSDMQKIGGGATYAERYGVAKLLALELDEDDDGNRASQPAARAPAQATNPPATASQGQNTASAPRPAPAASQGKGRAHPAPVAQEDDAEAVLEMARQLDQHAEDTGEKFRILKDGKIGLYGKVADNMGVEKGLYSMTQLASRGVLPKVREFYAFLCRKNDLPGFDNGLPFSGDRSVDLSQTF